MTKFLWGGIASVVLIVLTIGSLWLGYKNGQTSTLDARVTLNSGQIVIEVSADALYAITPTVLQQAGIVIQAEQWNADSISLHYREMAVPSYWQNETLIFYGQAPTSLYTNQRPYLLTISTTSGPQIAHQAVSPTTISGEPRPSIITKTQHLEENLTYISTTATKDYPDTWYWQTIHVQQDFTLSFELPDIERGGSRLQIHLFGTTEDASLPDDHDLDLIINDQKLTTLTWDGVTHYTADLPLPPNTLQVGANSITLDNKPAGAAFVDIMQLDWIELDYPAPAQAEPNGRLMFTTTTAELTLTGFSENSLIFDITDPIAPRILTEWEEKDGHITFDYLPNRQLIAIDPTSLAHPTRISAVDETPLLAQTNQADLIIITSPLLAPALQPLIVAREAQGLSVVLATTEEIYTHFGYGEKTPASIQSFLRYASNEWASPSPRYILLVGTSVYDYREYLDTYPHQVPSPLVPVVHSGETVSDARLVDLNDDFTPDLAIGRWPVDNLADVNSLVARTIAYEQGDASSETLFTADGSSPEFAQLLDGIIERTDTPVADAQKLYGSSFSEVASAWNQGTWLVTYLGHGSINLWGKDEVFTRDAVSQLTEGEYAPPIVLQFTCLTGYFAHPTQRSISELMLTHESGPVLLVGATSLTFSSDQEKFAEQLLIALQNSEQHRMGDALQSAKQSLDVSANGTREVSDTFGLLGDPSALIIRPSP